jgi:type I restriction enzyme S subunit
MSGLIDLRPDHLAIVEEILSEHVPHCEVRAFGSRATWTAKDYSDLDLAVVGDAPLGWRKIAHLKEAFEESDLPMRVDVVDWNDIRASFRERIEPDCVILRPADSPLSSGTDDPFIRVNSTGDDLIAGDYRTIGEFSPFAYGKGLPKRKRNTHGGVRVYGSNGVVGNHDMPLTDGPTVIIGRKGTVGAVHYSEDPCWPIDTTFYVEGDDPLIQRFVYYALKAASLSTMNSDSAVPGLNRSAVHAKKLFIPPTADRRAVSHILGSLDDKIELNRRMSETLEEMARALFKSWFVDFDPVRAKSEGRPTGLPDDLDALFPDSFEPSELGEIPAGWQVTNLGDLMELAYGKALRAQDRRCGQVPVYGSNGQVGWHEEGLVTGPGIVVGRKGNPGIVTWSPSDFFPIDTTFYVLPRDDWISLHFLYFALRVQDLPSVSADSAVPGLNRHLAYRNRQIVPPRQLVHRFDQCVLPIRTLASCVVSESETLSHLRDTLLPRLVSGELRVKVREDAPAPA